MRFPTLVPDLCLHILHFHTCSFIDGQDMHSLTFENLALNIWVFWFIAAFFLFYPCNVCSCKIHIWEGHLKSLLLSQKGKVWK